MRDEFEFDGLVRDSMEDDDLMELDEEIGEETDEEEIDEGEDEEEENL